MTDTEKPPVCPRCSGTGYHGPWGDSTSDDDTPRRCNYCDFHGPPRVEEPMSGMKHVDLEYPQSPSDGIDIALVHVRAARNIRVHYDFDRDGYVVTAPSYGGDAEFKMESETWTEVAFVPAWDEQDL